MASTFGQQFRVTTFGESHGPGIGAIVDGCPARCKLDLEQLQVALARRRPGQSHLTSQRKEADVCRILSGMHDGYTTGTPLALWIENTDAKSQDYNTMQDVYRPSHADYTYQQKYGIRAWQGGGRASARETAARVAAGEVARQVLQSLWPELQILAYVVQIHLISCTKLVKPLTREHIDSNPVRCPDATAAAQMERAILQARHDGDSLGGIVEAVASHVPVGWGEPIADKLEADLGHAMLSIPACKGFEVGSGFAGTLCKGSEHNDALQVQDGRIRTQSNFSGGIQGGISNGEPIVIRCAFKPTATILTAQQTVTTAAVPTVLTGKGRHDPCVVPRAVPIVEAMMAMVLLDHALRHTSHQLLPAYRPIARPNNKESTLVARSD